MIPRSYAIAYTLSVSLPASIALVLGGPAAALVHVLMESTAEEAPEREVNAADRAPGETLQGEYANNAESPDRATLKAWQVIFLIQGMLSVILGMLLACFLSPSPQVILRRDRRISYSATTVECYLEELARGATRRNQTSGQNDAPPSRGVSRKRESQQTNWSRRVGTAATSQEMSRSTHSSNAQELVRALAAMVSKVGSAVKKKATRDADSSGATASKCVLCLRSSGDWVHAEVIHFDLGESDVKDCDLQERQNCTSKTTAQVNKVTVDEERSCGSAVVTLRVSPGFRKKIHFQNPRNIWRLRFLNTEDELDDREEDDGNRECQENSALVNHKSATRSGTSCSAICSVLAAPRFYLLSSHALLAGIGYWGVVFWVPRIIAHVTYAEKSSRDTVWDFKSTMDGPSHASEHADRVQQNDENDDDGTAAIRHSPTTMATRTTTLSLMLSAVPYCGAVVGDLFNAWHSDLHEERFRHLVGAMVVGATGLFLTAAALESSEPSASEALPRGYSMDGNPTADGTGTADLRQDNVGDSGSGPDTSFIHQPSIHVPRSFALIALTITAAGFWGASGPFWGLVNDTPVVSRSKRRQLNHSDSRRSGASDRVRSEEYEESDTTETKRQESDDEAMCATALINSFGNIGGMVGPLLLGYVKERLGNHRPGLFVLTITTLGAVVPLLYIDYSNIKA